MPYQIVVDETQCLVTTTVSGVVDLATALEFSQRTRVAAQARQFDLVYDLRDISLAVSMQAVLQFPQQLTASMEVWMQQRLSAHVIANDRFVGDWRIYADNAARHGFRI